MNLKMKEREILIEFILLFLFYPLHVNNNILNTRIMNLFKQIRKQGRGLILN